MLGIKSGERRRSGGGEGQAALGIPEPTVRDSIVDRREDAGRARSLNPFQDHVLRR
jgi:hypothetical protein